MDKSIAEFISVKANFVKQELDKILEKELELVKGLLFDEPIKDKNISRGKEEQAGKYLAREIKSSIAYIIQIEVLKEKKEKLKPEVTLEEYLNKYLEILKKNILKDLNKV